MPRALWVIFLCNAENELNRTCLVPGERGGPSGLVTVLLQREKAAR